MSLPDCCSKVNLQCEEKSVADLHESKASYLPPKEVVEDSKLIRKKISYLNRIAFSGDIFVTSSEGNNKTTKQINKVPIFKRITSARFS